MADNIERLAVLIEANTKSYENAMKRLQSQTDQALKGVNDNFVRARKPAADLDAQITRAGHSASGMSTQAMALSHSLRSMAEGFAVGQSPSQILLQQLNHLSYAASGPGGLKGALNDLTGALGISFSRMALIGLGVAGGLGAAGVAAYAFYKLVLDDTPSAAQVTEEHARIIDKVKKAYQDAKVAAGQFNDEVKSALLLEAKQNLVDLQNQLKKVSFEFLQKIQPTQVIPLVPELGQLPELQDKFAAFRSIIDQFNESVYKGTPNVRALEQAIGDLGLKDPSLQKVGADLLKVARAAADAQKAVNDQQAGINLLTGKGTNQDRAQLGLSKPAATNAYKSLIDATKDQIKEFQFEAEHAREAGFAIDGLKKEHELLRAALKSGLPDTEATRNKIKELSDAYQEAEASAAAAKLQADLFQERQNLGLTPGEASIQQRLRSSGIDVTSAIGQQTAAELRLNDALTQTKTLAGDALSTLEDDFLKGANGATLLKDEIGLVEKQLLKMANENLLAGLFGGAGGAKSGGGGGIFGAIASIFGGFRAGGGDVSSGKAYVVGEKRPELFVPSTSGRIVPSVSGGGGSSSPTIIDQSTNHFNSTISGSDQNWVKNVVAQATQASEARMMKLLADQRARKG